MNLIQLATVVVFCSLAGFLAWNGNVFLAFMAIFISAFAVDTRNPNRTEGGE